MICILQSEKAKRDALAQVGEVADILVESANSEVHKIFCREKEIEIEVRQFTATAARFASQQQQWAALFRSFDAALKVRDTEANILHVIKIHNHHLLPFDTYLPQDNQVRVHKWMGRCVYAHTLKSTYQVFTILNRQNPMENKLICCVHRRAQNLCEISH